MTYGQQQKRGDVYNAKKLPHVNRNNIKKKM